MGIRIGIETDVARMAGNLVTAWESGDRRVLEVAVREAVNELGEAPPASAIAGEFRELLLGVAETLNDLLSTGQAAGYGHGSQWGACYDLLRHAQGAASAAYLRPQG
jgi:hypothetical protein